MHLKVETVGMWIIAANVVQAWTQFEGSLERSLQSRKLTSGHERPKVFYSGLDLSRCVNPRKPLFAIDLHQCEQAKRSHLAIGLREELAPLHVEHVCGFEWRPCAEVFDAARDLPQVEIFHTLRMFSEVAFEALEEIAGPVKDDQAAARVEDLVDS